MARQHLLCRNVTVNGRRTSLRMEPQYWECLREVVRREGMTPSEICSVVDDRRNGVTNLTSALRVFVLSYYRAAALKGSARQPGTLEAAMSDAVPL